MTQFVVRADWFEDEKLLRFYINDVFEDEMPCETLEDAQTVWATGVLTQEEFSKRVAARAAQC